MIPSAATGPNQLTMAVLVLLGLCAVILMALGFEHIGGYIPCKLCYGQREPYYVAIPIAMIASLSAWRRWPACLTRGALALIGLLMVYTVVLAAYHAGVEWGFWAGPADCVSTGDAVTNAGTLLDSLAGSQAPACDKPALRIFGLSFAGWNVIVSAILAAIAFYGAYSKGR